MGELEAELASLRDAAAAAEARASSMESTVSTAKEQLLRLNADFENFRRRTVSAAQGGGLYLPPCLLRNRGCFFFRLNRTAGAGCTHAALHAVGW